MLGIFDGDLFVTLLRVTGAKFLQPALTSFHVAAGH